MRIAHKLKGGDSNGEEIIYYDNSTYLMHREDGPARILRYDNGAYHEYWRNQSKKHRYGGPAEILKDANGDTNYLFYVNNKNVTIDVDNWLSDMGYVWDKMDDIELWELEMFMKSL